MTPQHHDSADLEMTQETFQEMLQEKLRAAVRLTMATVLDEEIEAYLQAGRYERTPKRQDQRNGYYTRGLGTGLGQVEDLPVPRSRKGYQTQLFKRYQRRQKELDTAICQMFVSGVSTEKVGQVVASLTGKPASASTVSRTFHTLEAEYAAWKERPLSSHYLYCFADGTYFTVIYGDEGHKMPILAVVGINPQGEKEVLGFTTGEKENQHAWQDLLADLKRRGVKDVDSLDQRRSPGHDERNHPSFPARPASTLCHPQNGKRAWLHSQTATGSGQTRAQGDLLSRQPGTGPTRAGRLLRKIRVPVSQRRCLPSAGYRCLSGLLPVSQSSTLYISKLIAHSRKQMVQVRCR